MSTKHNDAWKEALRPKIQLIQRVASSPDGEELFNLLANTFDTVSLRGLDTHDTYYKLGMRDVVQYLRELRDAKTDEDIPA